MKKITFYLVLAVALLAMPMTSQAGYTVVENWDIDFTPYGGMLVEDVRSISVSGQGKIIQNLGDDFVLDVGETFTSEAALYTFGFNRNAGGNITDEFALGIGNGRSLYFYSNDLAGEVISVGPGPNEFGFLYTSGTIDFFVGDTIGGTGVNDIASITNVTNIASLSIEIGLGDAGRSDDFDQVPQLQGSTRLLATFDADPSALVTSPAVFWPWVGLLFDLEQDIVWDPGFLPGNNPTFYTDQGVNYFEAYYTTSGIAELIVTPEPSTFLILGLGLLGLIGFRKRFNF